MDEKASTLPLAYQKIDECAKHAPEKNEAIGEVGHKLTSVLGDDVLQDLQLENL